MATNYGADATAIPVLESAAPVTAGVVKPSVSGQSITDIFSNISDVIGAGKASKAAKTLADFTTTQLNVADALDQGKIPNSAYARSVMRKNLLDAIHNNPSLASDLIKAQSSIVDLAGGADIVKEGNDEEQRWKSRKDQLSTAGLVEADASEEEFHQADLTNRQLVALNEQHGLRMQTLDEQLKSLSLSSAQRTELESQKKDEAYKFANQVAPSELKRVKGELDKIVTGPGTSAEKQQAIEVFWSQFLSDAQSLQMGLSSDDAGLFRKPFEVLKDTYIKQASGEYTAEDVKRQIELATNTQVALAMADPDIARVAAYTKIFGENIVVDLLAKSSGPVSKKIIDMIANGTSSAGAGDQPSPFATGSTDRAAIKGYLDSTAKVFNEGGEAKTEARDRIERVLSSVTDYQGLMDRDPKGAIELINWFASPEFQKAVASDPTLLEHTEAAQEALKRNYSKEVMGMINREFTNNQVVVPSLFDSGSDFMPSAKSPSVPATSLVTTQTTSFGMEFVPTDPNDPVAVDKAKQLNKDLKPIINTNIKAWAHLEGRTDYGKYWEETSSTLMDTSASDDKADDIALADFKALAELTGNYTPLVGIVDKTESGGSYDTILGHSQKSGGAFEGVKVSQMTIGQALDFSNGDYADYSKDAVGRKATPMGRYQIVGATLKQTAKEMGLGLDTPFNQETQDAMFAHLVQRALAGTSTLKGKRAALRGVWEGFKNVSNAELDDAISHFEGDS